MKSIWHLIMILVVQALMMVPETANAQGHNPDSEQLGMALEYFQAGKYHESLLIFQRLDKRHKLNPRFKAYIGLCYYQEWDYKKATEYFDKYLPELGGLAPHELSVYYYAAAESYFQMQNYDKAIGYFSRDLTVCYDREKGDVYYRIGLCHMFMKEWQQAYDDYDLSEQYYVRYRDTTDLEARLAQIRNMKNGCRKAIASLIDDERQQMLSQPADTVQEPLPSPWDEVQIPSFY